jgi:hypothetical protein
MKTKTTLLLVSLLFAVAAFGQSPNGACNLRSAIGAYGYSCSGAYQGQPFAAYGYVLADGKGQWHGYGKVSLNGTVLAWTHNTRPNDPATVNPDCTGSVTYEVTIAGQPAPDAHFEYVIVDKGREVKGFPVDAGYAVSCQLILEK